MSSGGAALFWFLVLGGSLVGLAWGLLWHLTPPRQRGRLRPWLLPWSLKGLLIPAAIWSLMNWGLSWSLQPYMPEIQIAQNAGGPWVPTFLRVAGRGCFIICSYWAGATLLWGLLRMGAATQDEARGSFKGLCWTCFLAMVAPAAIVLLVGGWPLLGLAVVLILAPVAGYAPSVLTPRALPPMYARAVARMKMGRYTEAEWEIIQELEKCEDDFDGWMMLAELYATHFRDPVEAEATILGICEQPSVTPSQLAVALHKLADWQLKLVGDPEAARRSLQMISDRLPGSHLAHMAQLRMNHLPRTAQELQEQQASRPIPLPALGNVLDEPAPQREIDRRHAAAQANECVERLKQDPNEVAVRERLARLFAESLDRADLGIEQLTLLLDMPDQPDSNRAEWLSLVAAWQLRFLGDAEAARRSLERLIESFPETPQAFAARFRITHMRTG